MSGKKNIIIILAVVVILALIIEFIRLDFVTKLSKNDNTTLIDYKQIQAVKGPDDAEVDKYLIIYDDSEPFVTVKDNFAQVLEYIHVNFDAFKIGDVQNISDQYKSVILITEDLDKLSDVNNLMQYVFEGGNLFVAFRLNASANFASIYRKLGIYEYNDFQDTKGIRLMDNVLIKGKGLEMKGVLVNSSMSLRITEDCDEYAESADGIKLLWKKKHGQGNIIYFNGSSLGEKTNRGLIMGSLSLLEEVFIYPIINSKVTFIDDFPAPFPEGKIEGITTEYGRTIPRFFKDIWWPNLLEMASRYDLKYSGVLISSFNDQTEEITPGSTELQPKDLAYFGRELISHGGEIGLHGYNHQPFYIQDPVVQSMGFKPWKDVLTMAASITEVNKLVQDAFPNYILQVYVPPANIMRPEAREAIRGAQSDLQIISSVYAKDSAELYEQEFAVSSDGFVEFPRLTNGYLRSEKNEWMVTNSITMHGLFSHFVTPGEVLESYQKTDRGWEKLLKDYDKFNELVFEDYPWLRGTTASQGANAMLKYLFAGSTIEQQDDYIKVTSRNAFDEIYFILRSKKGIESATNATLKEIDQNIYLVQSNSPVFQINFQR